MVAADLVLKNTNIITMNPGQPFARLAAIRGDQIIFVGRDEDIESVTGPGTQIIDCENMTLIPGFNDAHCHIFSFIRKQLTLDLSYPAVKSIAEIKEAIRLKAAITPPGQWINGSDYSDFDLVEKRHPTRWELDEVAPYHPVILSHRSLHGCVLNSQALMLAGIDIATPEPPGGSIHRDIPSGEPDGVLVDLLGYIRYKVMPPLSDSDLEQGITMADRNFVSLGITSLQDATVTNDVKRWQTYKRFKEKGLFRSRVYLMTGTDRLAEFRTAGLDFRTGDDSLRMGGLKIVLGEATGHLFPAQPDLNRIVLEAHRSGCQVAIHAVEPPTIEAAIQALEYAVSQYPDLNSRHRIEHCAESIPALFERLVRLGVVVSLQPPFLYYSGERYLALVKPENIPYLYRVKSFLEAGLDVAAGSDNPVVPNNPLVGVQAAVLRQTAGGRIIAPEERVSPHQALALYTSNAAYASFDEKVKGKIVPGQLADFVLLNADPTRVPAEQISGIKVRKTFIGGKVVWEG
jgi:predicted amidohydrolase YtcJ